MNIKPFEIQGQFQGDNISASNLISQVDQPINFISQFTATVSQPVWNVLWSTYGDQGFDVNAQNGVVVTADSQGGIYVGGNVGYVNTTTSTVLNDTIALKYNSLGDLQWSQTWRDDYYYISRYACMDSLQVKTVNGSERIYFLANNESYATGGYWIGNISPDGVINTSTIFGFFNSVPFDTEVDSLGNVYVGSSEYYVMPETTTTYFVPGLTKIDDSLNVVWNSMVDITLANDQGYASAKCQAVAVDTYDGVYTLNHYYNATSATYKVSLFKFNTATGAVLWQQDIGNYSDAMAVGFSTVTNSVITLVYDSVNTATVVGSFAASNGAANWQTVLPVGSNTIGKDISFDDQGALYIAGVTQLFYSESEEDFFFTKLNPSNGQVTAFTTVGSNQRDDHVTSSTYSIFGRRMGHILNDRMLLAGVTYANTGTGAFATTNVVVAQVNKDNTATITSGQFKIRNAFDLVSTLTNTTSSYQVEANSLSVITTSTYDKTPGNMFTTTVAVVNTYSSFTHIWGVGASELVEATLSNTLTWFAGNLTPAEDSAYNLGSPTNQWKSLYVSTSTIFVGGVPITVNPTNNTLVVGTSSNVSSTLTNLATESFVIDYVAQNGGGGGAGPIQPYLQLTNTPFIVQTATLGEPVTITAADTGINARFTVVIGEGPTIDSVTITTAGTGYSESQRYRIWSYDIGGPNDASSIDFTVDTVGENGEILTINNVGFVGTATNTVGTYTNAGAQLRASVFDAIGPGLTLTRDVNQGIYNIDLETEYDNNNYLSPLGTEWNSDGWGTLIGLGQRSYTTWRSALNNQVGNNILASELVMHDIANDKYYKFDFTAWNGSNGGYSYTRTEVTDPNYFVKTDGGSEVDIFVPDDGEGAGIGITRAGNNGIYNPYREGSWDSDVSPGGTLWNVDGWDDLSDLTTRTYQPFYAAFGNGGLGNKVPGSRTVMYIPETEKYYAIQWLSWTQGGNGGGFSYVRYEIDQTKLNEGVKFADGTVLKSAEGVGRVKSTAPGNRRIEEVSGFNQVTVTSRTTNSLTTVASRSQTNSTQVWVDITTTTIDDIIDNPQNYNNAYGFQFSLDNTNWYNYDFGYSSDGNERGFDIWPNQVTYDLGDTIYFRYFTGGESVVWWNSADLPSGSGNFRGAVIDYHAYTGESTIIGTIHIVDDSGEEHISHQEVQSGSTDGENDDLWVVTNEGQIRYRRIDGESKTLKIHWTAKVFYGSEYYD